MSEPAGPSPRSSARGPALAVVGFSATLLLLFGLVNLVQTSGRPAAVASPSVPPRPSAVASASAVPSADPSVGPSAPVASASASASPLPSPAGSPSPSPVIDPVLVGAGDIADCDLPGDSATAALIAGIPGTVFTAGDNAYPDGTADQFRDCYGPTWGRFLDRTRPAAGNHDWSKGDLAGYLGYFGTSGAPDGVSWYSYDLGTWHVVVLDSDCAATKGCGPDSAQGRWLASDLAASKARCTLAIWHHPRFSSGYHGGDAAVEPFWQALYRAGADVIVNGHEHDYERFAPQAPNGDEDRARGIRQFIVGTGGAALRTFGTPVRNSELRLSVSHGVIRFTLRDGSYDWSFLPTTGDVGDNGTAYCH